MKIRGTKTTSEVVMVCPTCEGRAYIRADVSIPSRAIAKAAHDLQLAGYSLREIGEKVGINGPQLVKYHIEQWKKFAKTIKKV
jgi:hypothetical protein